MDSLPRAGLSSRAALIIGLACVLVICCAPLFVRLGGVEQRNDEAIYSYSVDRMLETGHWLTPKNIPNDAPFLEKPPLKFWMVAGLMKAGLIPHDDWGMRFPDAVLCSLAFIYIYFLGVRLSGPVAGFSAVFLALLFQPFYFNHGTRGNNMEGALILAYCGGMYHFFRWAGQSEPSRRRHAWACCGYFFLGFMTKFVGAIFMPLVCAGAMAVRPAGWRDWRPKWRDWVAPAIVTILLILPWFVYQTIRDARWFWHVILMDHVVTRFTGVLIPSHLHPWHHYFTSLWNELQYSEILPPVVLGLVALAWRAWPRRQRSASAPGWWRALVAAPDAEQRSLARLLLLWWLLPEVLISFGTSKLFYYSYPFLPPLIVGAGLAISQLVDLAADAMRALGERLRLSGLRDAQADRWQARRLSYALTVIGALAFVVALSTAYLGSVDWEVAGVRLFKNSSVWRPFLVGTIAWYFAGLGVGAVKILAATAVVSTLVPLSGYEAQLHRFNQIDAPLRAARDCALAVQAAKNLPHNGAYKMSGDTDHPYYYYLWRLGPYQWPETARGNELQRRLDVVGDQSLVVMSVEDYAYLGGMIRVPPPVANPDSGVMPEVSAAAKSAELKNGLPPAVAMSDSVVVLFPGEYASCTRQVAHAGPRTRRLDAVSPR